MAQIGDIGGFSVTFDHNGVHERDSDHNMSAAAEGHIWADTFHYQDRRGHRDACNFQPQK